MKRLSFCLFLTLLVASLSAQHMALDWGVNLGDDGWETAGSIVVDPFDNVYVTGMFTDTFDIDPGPGVFNMEGLGVQFSRYLIKYDPAGNIIWAKSFQSGGYNGQGNLNWLDVDSLGNIYMAGYFRNSFDADPGPGTFNLTASSLEDFFVLKLDPNGGFEWAINLSNPNEQLNWTSIAVDAIGNCFIHGYFTGRMDFDPGPGQTFLTQRQGFGDLFILKLDTIGNFSWVKQLGNDSYIYPTFAQVDKQGNHILSGYFQDNLDIDPGSGILLFESPNATSLFLLKLDGQGNFLWANQVGDSLSVGGGAFTLDPQDHLYMVGHFSGELDIDPGPGTFLLEGDPNSLYHSTFLQKLNSNGELMWAGQFDPQDSSFLNIYDLRSDQEGNIYVAGDFTGSVDFEPGPGINVQSIRDSLGDSIRFNGFVARFNENGNFNSIGQLEGESIALSDIALDSDLNLYLTGEVAFFNLDIDPGPDTFLLRPAQGSRDMFVAKWSQDSCAGIAVVINSIQYISCGNAGFVSGYAVGGFPPYSYAWNTNPPGSDTFLIVHEAGVYELTVTDSLACQNSTAVYVEGPTSQNAPDLQINLVSTPFRTGFPACLWLDVSNEGCGIGNGIVEVVLDSLLNFDTASILPDSLNGDTLIWNVNNLLYGGPDFRVKIDLTVDLMSSIGDTVCLEASIIALIGDANSNNNKRNPCSPIINAYDPNDIQVAPVGACEEGFITQDEVLRYTIRFQNTGNADAINVFILDTLDAALDLSSFKLISESHKPMIIEVLEDRVLKFRFDNIHLPDSSTNEALSHGYVVYEIAPKPNLPIGSPIHNQASIFFDFNEPVLTNTVLNTLIDTIPTFDNTIRQEGASLFSKETAVGVSYQWLDCDNANTPIAGAISRSFSPGKNGNYAVRIRSGGCEVVSECFTINNVGIDPEFQSQIKFYPNPSEASVEIELGNNYSEIEIKIFNLLGKEESRQIFFGVDQLKLELPDEKGLYMIQVKAHDKRAVLKALKL